ncbi:MAG TPA: hypothetical protein VMF65_22120 [Acidimicrobiales bacterium]|nr:hypothetical protein [Acidimicrobiales bacterium]
MIQARSSWYTLIIRVWVDETSGLRARLTEVNDVDSPEGQVAVVDDAEDLIDAVRVWLSRLEEGQEP